MQKQEETDGKLSDYTALIREEYENADEILSGFSAPETELNELSVACGYSREHLGRTIKRFTGKTFSEHLGDFRAERAKRLLTDTSLTIDEIARMTGGLFYHAQTKGKLRDIYNDIDKLEKTKLRVKNFDKRYEAYQPFALAAFVSLLLEMLLRTTLLRRIP